MREQRTPRSPDPTRWPTRVLRLVAAAFGVAVAAAVVGLGIWRSSPASVLFPVFLLAFALGGDRLAAAVTGLCFGVRDTGRAEPASGHDLWSDGVPDDLLDAYERASIRAGIAPEAAWLVHLAVASRTDPGDAPACGPADPAPSLDAQAVCDAVVDEVWREVGHLGDGVLEELGLEDGEAIGWAVAALVAEGLLEDDAGEGTDGFAGLERAPHPFS